MQMDPVGLGRGLVPTDDLQSLGVRPRTRLKNKVSHTPPPLRKMCEILQGPSRLGRLTMLSVIGYPYNCTMLGLLECGSTKRKKCLFNWHTRL